MREIALGRRGWAALVDDEDYERIAAHKWHCRADRYVVRWNENHSGRIRLHREVLGFPDARFIDHANGDPLDNRRANLRICTAADNARNSKAVAGKLIKGVQLINGRWRARIRINGHLTHIGSFTREWEAALAYDRAAREHFGEFACLNFPEKGERSASFLVA